MQSETGFPSSHQLKSYVAFKSRLKLAARAVLSADAGLLVHCFSPLPVLPSSNTVIFVPGTSHRMHSFWWKRIKIFISSTEKFTPISEGLPAAGFLNETCYL